VSRANGFAEYRWVQQRRTYLRLKPSVDFSPPVAVSDELLDYCETRGDFTLLACSPTLPASAWSSGAGETPAVLALHATDWSDRLPSSLHWKGSSRAA
jgi:hypothetical protein